MRGSTVYIHTNIHTYIHTYIHTTQNANVLHNYKARNNIAIVALFMWFTISHWCERRVMNVMSVVSVNL